MESRFARKQGTSATASSPSNRAAGSSLGLAATSTPHLIRELRRGLAFRALEFLSSESGISVSEIADLVEIPPRPLARRKASGRLAPAESARLLRVSRVVALALGALDREVADAPACLRTPRRTFAGTSQHA